MSIEYGQSGKAPWRQWARSTHSFGEGESQKSGVDEEDVAPSVPVSVWAGAGVPCWGSGVW